MPRPRVSTTTTMAPPAHLDIIIAMTAMQHHRNNSRPHEEDNLHNAERKARLQHRAGLIEVESERVIRASAPFAKRTQGDDDRPAIPAAAVGIGDETQLVDSRDESAQEAQVDEGDEDGGAFCCAEADERVDAPEDGEHADDEEDQDVGWGELICFDVAIDEVGLLVSGQLSFVFVDM